MAVANTKLLQTLTDLWRARADASVIVDSGRTRRILHVARGEWVGADSDMLTERLGVLLVADDLLDAGRVEELVAAATAKGHYLGDHLVAEGLVSAEKIQSALERQAQQRFDRALTMAGEVEVVARERVRVVVQRPLGPELIRAFRERLPVGAASALVAQLEPRNDRLQEELFTADALVLTAAELRCFRQLASGQGAAAVLDRAMDYEAALRLIGALVGMGAVGGALVDPIRAFLRTA